LPPPVVACYLVSPIGGGVDGAAAGTLAVMSSGPADAYQKVRPHIETFGKGIHYLGEQPGYAQTIKLINNMLSTTRLVMACEAFVFGTKAGLDPDLMLEAINSKTTCINTYPHRHRQLVRCAETDVGLRSPLRSALDP
jgi:3-hydroxyisobutyrate dehydrogenase-like beta-hydroxyacid dehydrogenase